MNRFVLTIPFALALLYSPPASPFATSAPRLIWHGNWVETDGETLWRDRYTNEDYGYTVVLGPGVIGHGTHSPSPNHGFMVPLPDVRTVSYVSNRRTRFIWVDASYDVLEDEDPSAALKDHDARGAVLGGRHAIETTIRSSSPDGTFVDSSILVRRCGIIYTVGMHTSQRDRIADKQQFDEIVRGFHFLNLPANECPSS